MLSMIRTSLIWVFVAAAPGWLTAQSYVELQQAMDETTVEEKVGQSVALNARFKDIQGNWYSLKEFFFEDRPVFLSLNYANCPQLCQNQLKMLAERLDEVGLIPGEDYEFISISIDPREALTKTMQARESFCRLLVGKPQSDGVHFLVGKKADIDAVAQSVGFVYSYVPSANHYSHAPLCVALTPEGKISRYIHGLGFSAEDLKESQGIAKSGQETRESIASFVYRCLLFGVNPGQYTGDLMVLMRIAGIATVIIICACVVPFWFRGGSHRESTDGKSESDDRSGQDAASDVKPGIENN